MLSDVNPLLPPIRPYSPADSSPKDVPLVYIAQFAALSDSAEKRACDESRRDRAYRLLKVARKLLPGERVAKCQATIVPGRITAEVDFDEGHSRFGGLIVCDSPWHCPLCARRISEQKRKELDYAVRRAMKKGLVPVMLTFTVAHTAFDSVASVAGAFKSARRYMTALHDYKRLMRAYGVQGWVRDWETTFTDNGAHVHSHVLVFCKFSEFARCEPDYIWGATKQAAHVGAFLAYQLAELWQRSLAHFGAYASNDFGVDVKVSDQKIGSYIAKWGIAHEMTKSHAKVSKSLQGRTPFQLLDDYAKGDERAGRLFQEYAHVFKGSHPLEWSSNAFKAGLLEGFIPDTARDPAGDLAEQDDKVSDKGKKIELTREQWYVVASKGLQGEVLKVAARGDEAALWAYLYSIGVPRVKVVNATDYMWAECDRIARKKRE